MNYARTRHSSAGIISVFRSGEPRPNEAVNFDVSPRPSGRYPSTPSRNTGPESDRLADSPPPPLVSYPEESRTALEHSTPSKTADPPAASQEVPRHFLRA